MECDCQNSHWKVKGFIRFFYHRIIDDADSRIKPEGVESGGSKFSKQNSVGKVHRDDDRKRRNERNDVTNDDEIFPEY